MLSSDSRCNVVEREIQIYTPPRGQYMAETPPRRSPRLYMAESPLRRSPRLSRNYVPKRSSAGGVVSISSSSRSTSSASCKSWSVREQELGDEGRGYLQRAPQLRNRLLLDQEGHVKRVEGSQMPLEIDLVSNRTSSPGLNILSQALENKFLNNRRSRK